MRVLWVAPWFRTLAGVWAEPLRAAGHEVLVVTSPRHFETRSAGAPELVLEHGPRDRAAWPELARTVAAVRRFAPQVVVADEVRDPRLLALAPRAPLVLLVHDARPHDADHRRPWRHDLVIERQYRRAQRILVFSEDVGAALRRDPRARCPVLAVPLPSEMTDHLVPPFVDAAARRDFVLPGRLGPYKNVPTVFAAWRRHLASPHYRGDRLLLLGDGDPGAELPPATVWHRERFAFADRAPTVAACKGSIAFYRAGSQSGVVQWSMQLGVPTVRSDVGGLAESLPPGEPAFRPDDVAGLAGRLDHLADPEVAAAAGRVAQRFYRDRYGAPVSADRIAGVLQDVVRCARRVG